jgi:hypothetical protein
MTFNPFLIPLLKNTIQLAEIFHIEERINANLINRLTDAAEKHRHILDFADNYITALAYCLLMDIVEEDDNGIDLFIKFEKKVLDK